MNRQTFIHIAIFCIFFLLISVESRRRKNSYRDTFLQYLEWTKFFRDKWNSLPINRHKERKESECNSLYTSTSTWRLNYITTYNRKVKNNHILYTTPAEGLKLY